MKTKTKILSYAFTALVSASIAIFCIKFDESNSPRYSKIVEFSETYGSLDPIKLMGVQQGALQEKLFEFYLNNGGDPNFRTTEGCPLLIVLINNPNTSYDVVSLFLQKGADPASKFKGYSAGDTAKMAKREDYVRLLSKYGR